MPLQRWYAFTIPVGWIAGYPVDTRILFSGYPVSSLYKGAAEGAAVADRGMRGRIRRNFFQLG